MYSIVCTYFRIIENEEVKVSSLKEQNMKKAIEDFNKAYDTEGDIFHEYLAFSQFFQRAFISEDGYIVDTGNFETVNREMIDLVYERIKKHPIIWKLFFMIA